MMMDIKRNDPLAPPFTDDPSSPFCTDIDAALAWSLKEDEKTDVRYTLEEAFDMIREHTHGRKVV